MGRINKVTDTKNSLSNKVNNVLILVVSCNRFKSATIEYINAENKSKGTNKSDIAPRFGNDFFLKSFITT